MDYTEVGRRKREQRDNLIPPAWRLPTPVRDSTNALDIPEPCGLLSARELEITSQCDAVDILQKLRAGSYSAEEVTVAFCKRAAIAQALTNCLTEIFFNEAIERARSLDKERAANPDAPLRPLHGLPISLKDSFRVPGVDSTVGMICWAHQPDDEYSPLPKLLLDLGAILYCKTNVPQTMMTADSDNNVFGRTLNPARSNLTAGGSSGGEGALIAMRGSVLGIGTDIAGSIRIPSLCNGLYGMRPSADIVPMGGQRDPCADGTVGVIPVAGPMATSLRSCEFFIKTIMDAKAWRYDPDCLHLPWRNQSPIPSLRIGVVEEDGMYTPWPPVRRTILETTEKLRAAGVTVVPLSLPDWHLAFITTCRLYGLDGGKFVEDLFVQGAEPPVLSVQRSKATGIPASTLDEFFELNAVRQRIQKAYLALWLEHNLDAIIMPPAPTTATPIDEWDSITYTSIWNFLDYPCVIIPTGKVNGNDHADSADHAKHGEEDERHYNMYTGPSDFEGAALAIQLVGMRQEDEELLNICTVVEKALKL